MFWEQKAVCQNSAYPPADPGRPWEHHLPGGTKTGGQGEALSADAFQNKYQNSAKKPAGEAACGHITIVNFFVT